MNNKQCIFCLNAMPKESSMWKRMGYCSSEHFVQDSRWLLDKSLRDVMGCFCDSPSAHVLACPWRGALKRTELLHRLGIKLTQEKLEFNY